MGKEIRKTGVDIIGDVRWGTHFCQFYQTKEDLIDILAPYFKAGLENNEFCMWVTSEPLKVEEAKLRLGEVVGNLDYYIRSSQIEILDYTEWYTKTGVFEVDKVLQGWIDKENEALKRGFDGLRLTGSTFWLEKKDWQKFADYEEKVNSVIGDHRMLAICTYSLDKCGASEVIDVVKNHQFALIRRKGRWELIESTERKQAEEALRLQSEIVANMGEGVLLTRVSDRMMVYANPRFEEMFGYGPGELAGKHVSVLNAPGERTPEEVAGGIIKQLNENGVWYGEVHNIKKDGTRFWCRANISTFEHPMHGKVDVNVLEDVTERKQAEETLRESEDRFRIASQIASDVVYERDLQTGIATFYGDIDSHLGYEPGEYPHNMEGWREHVHPEDLAWFDTQSMDQLELGVPYSVEYRMRKKDGTYMTWSDRIMMIWDEKTGKPLKFIGAATDITERKQAEQMLSHERDLIQTLFENHPDFIYFKDSEARFHRISKRFCDFFGLSEEDIIGKTDLELFPEEVAKQTYSDDLHVIKTGIPLINREESAGEVWVLTTKIPWFDKEGNIIGLFGISRDFTERKRAEEVLRESEDRYKTLVETAGEVGEGIAVIQNTDDQQTTVVFLNSRFPEMLGYTREEMIGKSAWNFIPADSLAMLQERYMKRQKGEDVPKTYETAAVRKDGTLLLIEVAMGITTYGGKIASVAYVRDITKRKRAEELYRILLTSSPTSVYIAQEGKIVFANPQFYNFMGYGEDDLLGMDPLMLVHPEDREYARQNAVAMLKGNRSSPYELRVINKRGEMAWCVGTASSIDYKGKRATLGNFMDITERKQAEEREERLQQELNISSRLASIGQLAAGVAHEINNPLTGILAFSERLLRKSTDEEASRNLERIHSEALRVARVVENLRAFARRSEPKKEYSDINEILDRALELRAYELKTSNIEVETVLDSDIPRAMVDFQQLQQVFLNIILNAEQAMTEANDGGKLTIKTQPMKGYIRVSFTDDGPGIPAENLDRVFDPFFTTRGERGGTGLGLSLCHGIVTEHGGRIYARSKPGKGATFFVELPLTSDRQMRLVEANIGLNYKQAVAPDWR